MQNCGFGWQNTLLSATFAASGQAPWLPVENLKTPHGAASFAWRVPSTSAAFQATLAEGSTFRAFSLHRTNLTPNARWTTIVYPDLNPNANAVVIWDAPALVSNGQCAFVWASPVPARRISVWIDDPGNPDGFLSIPLAFAGDLWQPQRNFSTASTSGLAVGQQSVTSLSGCEFVEPRFTRRTLSIAHQSYGGADLATLARIQGVAAVGQNILFLPDPAAPNDVLSRNALFGQLSGGDVSNPFGTADRHAQTFTLTERL